MARNLFVVMRLCSPVFELLGWRFGATVPLQGLFNRLLLVACCWLLLKCVEQIDSLQEDGQTNTGFRHQTKFDCCEKAYTETKVRTLQGAWMP